jgi:hypothetical protein
VDTTRVVWPAAASLTAKLADKLVLPTPPFPLIMMYLRSLPAASSSKQLAASAAATCVTCGWILAAYKTPSEEIHSC